MTKVASTKEQQKRAAVVDQAFADVQKKFAAIAGVIRPEDMTAYKESADATTAHYVSYVAPTPKI